MADAWVTLAAESPVSGLSSAFGRRFGLKGAALARVLTMFSLDVAGIVCEYAIQRRSFETGHLLIAPMFISVTDGGILVVDACGSREQSYTADGALIRCVSPTRTQVVRSAVFTGFSDYISKRVVNDSSGETFLADAKANCIRVFDRNERLLREIGADGEGKIGLAADVALDVLGNVLVCCNRTDRVLMFRPDGTFIWSVVTPFQPFSICVDSQSTVYVCGRYGVFLFG